MTNLINIENLNGVEKLTPARFIGISAIEIINAGILANSDADCVTESRRIYKTGSKWQSVKQKAKRTLRIAKLNGLSVEKPYKIIDGVLWAFVGSSFAPCCEFVGL